MFESIKRLPLLLLSWLSIVRIKRDDLRYAGSLGEEAEGDCIAPQFLDSVDMPVIYGEQVLESWYPTATGGLRAEVVIRVKVGGWRRSLCQGSSSPIYRDRGIGPVPIAHYRAPIHHLSFFYVLSISIAIAAVQTSATQP
jgi:hypothetical protein